jgi:hypothetical protein
MSVSHQLLKRVAAAVSVVAALTLSLAAADELVVAPGPYLEPIDRTPSAATFVVAEASGIDGGPVTLKVTPLPEGSARYPAAASSSQDGVTADGVEAAGWPVQSGSQVGYSSPAVCDLDGDQSQDIVVHANDALEAYGQDGSLLPGWPQPLDTSVGGNSLIGSPVVSDIDDDGDPEILVGHFQNMYAFHHDGTILAGWPVGQGHPFGPLFATPAVADLDGDGDQEICFKIYGGNGDPADIHLLHHDGSPVAGWPKLGLDRSHLSSPVIADIDANGDLDIVVSLHFFNAGNFVRAYVWRADGSDVPGFPVTGSWNTAPENNAVGDVDGDGFLEIFVSTSNYTSPFYALHAWNHDGSPLSGSWPRSAPLCGLNGSPALADVNGGLNEIVLGVGGCYQDDPGAVNVWQDDGSPLSGWPVFVPGWLRSSPLVMDSDADGTPEIYIGSSDGWIYRFLTGDATGGAPPQWNQIFHDPGNTNSLPLTCPGDLDGDGGVDIGDLLGLFSLWGPCPGPPGCPGDLNGDGAVGVGDMLVVFANWGPCS